MGLQSKSCIVCPKKGRSDWKVYYYHLCFRHPLIDKGSQSDLLRPGKCLTLVGVDGDIKGSLRE